MRRHHPYPLCLFVVNPWPSKLHESALVIVHQTCVIAMVRIFTYFRPSTQITVWSITTGIDVVDERLSEIGSTGEGWGGVG